MTRIYLRGGDHAFIFDVAEDLNAVKAAMENAMRIHAPISFVKLTCVREHELGRLVYLRVDDISAVEERD